jgi:ParB family chromosome partitioning protein
MGTASQRSRAGAVLASAQAGVEAAHRTKVGAGVPPSGRRKALLRELPMELIANSSPVQRRAAFNPAISPDDAEFLADVRERGVQTPIQVYLTEPDGESGTASYTLVFGHRRYDAARMAGFSTIPALVRAAPASSQEELEVDLATVTENVHRSALNALEQARTLADLKARYGLNNRELAAILHKSDAFVSSTLAVLDLPLSIQTVVAAGQASATTAVALGKLGESQSEKAIALHRKGIAWEESIEMARTGRDPVPGQMTPDVQAVPDAADAQALHEALVRVLGLDRWQEVNARLARRYDAQALMIVAALAKQHGCSPPEAVEVFDRLSVRETRAARAFVRALSTFAISVDHYPVLNFLLPFAIEVIRDLRGGGDG